MLRTIIIDDEPNARAVLNSMISAYCPDIEILGMAGTITEAYNMIQALQPELLFLDIEMQGETCFELIERFENPNFDIIFVTGYDNHALKAIKFSALDYLLKPVNDIELVNKVQKIVQQKADTKIVEKLQNLSRVAKSPTNRKNKLIVTTSDGIELIAIDTILRCEAAGRYTTLHLTNKRIVLTTKDLKSYQDLLEDYGFYRVHDAHLVYHAHIQKVQSGEEDILITTDYNKIPISRRRKQDFQEWLRQF